MINDAAATPEQRLDALRERAESEQLPEFTKESNNHIHTIYSFSPYTPSMAALRGREAGLRVVGSVDHDSIGAAAEMREAASILGMGAVTGFEVRVQLHTPAEVEAGKARFADRKLNNPDSVGVAYMTVQGIPARSRAAVEQFLAPIRAARIERTKRMAEAANEILRSVEAPTFDFERDVLGISMAHDGGTVTERHLLFAMAGALIEGFGKGEGLVEGLEKMGIKLGDDVRRALADRSNPFLQYDLLGVLKSEYLEQFYIQPKHQSEGGELPDAPSVVEFAKSIGAIPCYAYLGDVTESPTGDKKAEKFEDKYLDELVEYLAGIGFPAITYMPPRNTDDQLKRLAKLAKKHGLIEVSGVDINQPRQQFNCPELGEKRFDHLNTATWALVAHETLGEDERYGLLSPNNPLTDKPLLKRVERYGKLGPRLVEGERVEQLIEELES